MPSNVSTPAATVSTPAATKPAAAVNTAKPAIIATRRRCEADGVGLSHYILMDRKARQ